MSTRSASCSDSCVCCIGGICRDSSQCDDSTRLLPFIYSILGTLGFIGIMYGIYLLYLRCTTRNRVVQAGIGSRNNNSGAATRLNIATRVNGANRKIVRGVLDRLIPNSLPLEYYPEKTFEIKEGEVVLPIHIQQTRPFNNIIVKPGALNRKNREGPCNESIHDRSNVSLISNL